MAGVAATLTEIGLEDAMAKLRRLGGFQMAQLADDAGAILESSTRRRFDTAQAPDGDGWVPWSEAYDETRGDHHSLLVSDGDLRDTIASYSGGTEVSVGSGQIYAAHHHFGGEEIGTNVPARPFLGVSNEDRIDLTDLVHLRLQELLS